MFFSEEETIH